MRPRHRFESVKHYFAEQQCELLEDHYRNIETPMRYRCVCGSISNISFANFKAGKRCQQCKKRKISASKDKHRHSQEYVRECFLKAGLEMLEEYKEANSPIKFRCLKNGHVHSISFYCLNRRGQGCAYCSGQRASVSKEELRRHRLFKKKCYYMLAKCRKLTGQTKLSRTEQCLGYTFQQLHERLATYPNWESIKEQQWHLDHIFPIKAFLDRGITDLRIINHISNLQPLLPHENSRKNDYYDSEAFELFLASVQ